MALCGQDKQAACVFDFLLPIFVIGFNFGANFFVVILRRGSDGLHDLEFNVATKFDVGPAARHIGRDCDSPKLACISYNLCFLLVLARVQDIMLHALFGQHLTQELRLFNRGRAHKNGLAFGIGFFDRLNDGGVFFLRRTVDGIVIIYPCNGLVCRNFDNPKTVDFHEFFGFCCGGSSHASKFVIEAEVVLESYLSQSYVFGLNIAAFLCFDCLMKPL